MDLHRCAPFGLGKIPQHHYFFIDNTPAFKLNHNMIGTKEPLAFAWEQINNLECVKRGNHSLQAATQTKTINLRSIVDQLSFIARLSLLVETGQSWCKATAFLRYFFTGMCRACVSALYGFILSSAKTDDERKSLQACMTRDKCTATDEEASPEDEQTETPIHEQTSPEVSQDSSPTDDLDQPIGERAEEAPIFTPVVVAADDDLAVSEDVYLRFIKDDLRSTDASIRAAAWKQMRDKPNFAGGLFATSACFQPFVDDVMGSINDKVCCEAVTFLCELPQDRRLELLQPFTAALNGQTLNDLSSVPLQIMFPGPVRTQWNAMIGSSNLTEEQRQLLVIPDPQILTKEDRNAHYNALYDAMPKRGIGKLWQQYSAMEFEKAQKSLLALARCVNPMKPGSRADLIDQQWGRPGNQLRNWADHFRENILGNDDPKLRKLGYVFLRNCGLSFAFLIDRGQLQNLKKFTNKYNGSCAKDNEIRDEVRCFILASSTFLKQAFPIDLQAPIDLFEILGCQAEAIAHNDYADFIAGLFVADANTLNTFLTENDSAEFRQILIGLVKHENAWRNFAANLPERTNSKSNGSSASHLHHIFYLCRDAFPDLLERSPDDFVQFVIFSPNPAIRQEGLKVATEKNFDWRAYSEKHIGSYLRNAFNGEMCKIHLDENYEFLQKNNLIDLVMEKFSDVFMDQIIFTAKSVDLFTMGINFIINNGLLPGLAEKFGQRIIQYVLDPSCNLLSSVVLCPLLQSPEAKNALMKFRDFFWQECQRILTANRRPASVSGISAMIRIFSDGGEIPQENSAQISALKSPILLQWFYDDIPAKDCENIPEGEIFTVKASDVGSSGLDSFNHMLGEWLAQRVQAPLFSLHQSEKWINDRINDIGEPLPDKSAAEKKHQKIKEDIAAAQREIITKQKADTKITPEFVREILCSPDAAIREQGYVDLKKKFPDPARLKVALKTIDPGTIYSFFPRLFLNISPYATEEMVMNLTPYDNKEQCDGVTTDALKFFEDAGLNDILAMQLKPPSGPQLAVLLAASPDAKLREDAYKFIEEHHVDFKAPMNFGTFVQMIIGSENDDVRKDGVEYLRKQGIKYVRFDDEIYKLK